MLLLPEGQVVEAWKPYTKVILPPPPAPRSKMALPTPVLFTVFYSLVLLFNGLEKESKFNKSTFTNVIKKPINVDSNVIQTLYSGTCTALWQPDLLCVLARVRTVFHDIFLLQDFGMRMETGRRQGPYIPASGALHYVGHTATNVQIRN